MKLFLLDLGQGLPPSLRDEWKTLADPQRRKQLSTYKDTLGADRSLAGEMLARYALALDLRRAPSSLEFVRADSGKPSLVASGASSPSDASDASGAAGAPGPPRHFSISHAGRFVACATAATPVGVDLEVKAVKAELAPWFCHPAELALLAAAADPALLRLRLWTLKESWIKCIASGVGRHMASLDLSVFLHAAGSRTLFFTAHGFTFHSLCLPGASMAVCLQNTPDGPEADLHPVKD